MPCQGWSVLVNLVADLPRGIQSFIKWNSLDAGGHMIDQTGLERGGRDRKRSSVVGLCVTTSPVFEVNTAVDDAASFFILDVANLLPQMCDLFFQTRGLSGIIRLFFGSRQLLLQTGQLLFE